MKTLQLQEVKAHFSGLVDEVARGEEILVTRHGRPAAMLVPVEKWEHLTGRVPALVDLLLAFPGGPEDVPPRNRVPLRDVDL